MSTISKVLITGAAGKVAQGIIRKLSNKYSDSLLPRPPTQFFRVVFIFCIYSINNCGGFKC